jgi:hypothetical protein
MLKEKNPPMILSADLKSKDKTLRTVNRVLEGIWVELARLDRRLKRLKKGHDGEV